MKTCRSVIQIIGGDDFEFKSITICAKCSQIIFEDEERLTVGTIAGITMAEQIAFNWADYCEKCAVDIKKACVKETEESPKYEDKIKELKRTLKDPYFDEDSI